MGTKEINKIVSAGEGGQGIQVLAKILSAALASAGYEVSYIPEFGPEQRGTPSVAYIQFSRKKIAFPKFRDADLLVILRKRALKLVLGFIRPSTQIVFDSSTIPRRLIAQKNVKVFGIPATKIAKDKFKPFVLNIIVLGALANSIFGLDKAFIWSLVRKQLETKFAKKPELEEINKKALEYGYELSMEITKYSRAEYDTTDKIIVKKGAGKSAVLIPKFCKGCGICIEKCPVKALRFGDTLGVYGTPSPEIDLEKCIACGNCFRFCPDSAIKVEKN